MAGLPDPYDDYVIVISEKCPAALINDPKNTGKAANVSFVLCDQQVHSTFKYETRDLSAYTTLNNTLSTDCVCSYL